MFRYWICFLLDWLPNQGEWEQTTRISIHSWVGIIVAFISSPRILALSEMRRPSSRFELGLPRPFLMTETITSRTPKNFPITYDYFRSDQRSSSSSSSLSHEESMGLPLFLFLFPSLSVPRQHLVLAHQFINTSPALPSIFWSSVWDWKQMIIQWLFCGANVQNFFNSHVVFSYFPIFFLNAFRYSPCSTTIQ